MQKRRLTLAVIVKDNSCIVRVRRDTMANSMVKKRGGEGKKKQRIKICGKSGLIAFLKRRHLPSHCKSHFCMR
jgi:hypothetical protein